MADRPTTFDELADRLIALEARNIVLKDLPLKQLMLKLQQDWDPDGTELLGKGSITPDVLDPTLLGSSNVLLTREGSSAGFANDAFMPLGGDIYRFATAGSAKTAFWFDPAKHVVTGADTYLQVVLAMSRNTTATGAVTFYGGMRPVTGFGGGAGIDPTISSVGADLGATDALSLNVLQSDVKTGAAFQAPAAGFYFMDLGASGAIAANSFVAVSLALLISHTSSD